MEHVGGMQTQAKGGQKLRKTRGAGNSPSRWRRVGRGRLVRRGRRGAHAGLAPESWTLCLWEGLSHRRSEGREGHRASMGQHPSPPTAEESRGSSGSRGHCRGRQPHQFSHGRSTALPGGWRRPPWAQGQSRVGMHMLFWNQKPSTAFWFPAWSAHAPLKQNSAPTWQAPTLKCQGRCFQTPISSQFPALGERTPLGARAMGRGRGPSISGRKDLMATRPGARAGHGAGRAEPCAPSSVLHPQPCRLSLSPAPHSWL